MMRNAESRVAVQLSVQPISAEGLPLLLPLLDHEDPVIARGAAAVIGDWYFATLERDGDRDTRWTEYQGAHVWAQRRIAPHEEAILQLIPERNWPHHRETLKRHTARWI